MFMETSKQRGRPRLHDTNADRQRDYRRRRNRRLQPPKPPEPPKNDSIHDWNIYLASIGLSVDEGAYVGDILFHTGGNDSNNLQALDARQESKITGRRVTPKGAGPDQ